LGVVGIGISRRKQGCAEVDETADGELKVEAETGLFLAERRNMPFQEWTIVTCPS
jgi:hypothetical protein